MRSSKFGIILEFRIIFLLLFFFCWGRGEEVLAGGTLSENQCSNNCQNIINSALASGGVVHLNAGTYVISDTIKLNSGNTLEGDENARIVLINNANWPRYKNMIEGRSVSNVRIRGFEIDGNRANNTTSDGIGTACGKYFYTMIYFLDSSNIQVDNMFLHHNWNDILKFSSCNGVTFHDNTVRQPGHDVVYAIGSSNVDVYNNYIRIYCNSGVRPDGTKNIDIYNNDIARDDGAGGYAGIEIQGESTVRICNNNIHNVASTIVDLSGGDASISYSGCETGTTPTTGKEGGSTGSTGGGGDAGGDTGGSGGDTGGSSGGGSTTPSWNPSGSILDDNPYSNIDPALPSSERDLNSLYPKLGNAPATATNACSSVPNSAGFIPCGRNMDDPATSWNECNECSLCSMVLMGQLTVEFLVKISGIAATLALILAGFIYIFAAGREDLISRSKSMIKYTLMGFIIIFIAWAVVDSLLTVFNYIDPVEGEWHTVC